MPKKNVQELHLVNIKIWIINNRMEKSIKIHKSINIIEIRMDYGME